MKVRSMAVRNKKPVQRVAGVLCAALALASCSGDNPLTPAKKLGSSPIQLSQQQVDFSTPGESTVLQVAGASAGTVTWSTADPLIADVDATGVVSAVSSGSTYVVARVGSWKDSAYVTVAPQQAVTVSVKPDYDTLTAVGATVRLTAKAYDRRGNPVKATFVWTSLNGAVATVASDGTVTAVQPGVAQVVAAAGALADTATVLVMQAVSKVTMNPSSATTYVGQAVAFSAVALDAQGNIVSSQPVTWASSSPGVAAVSNGIVTGISSGSAQITASAGGKSASASVQVSQVPVAAVVVSPASASVSVGGAVQLTASTLDASGNTLAGRAITWTSSNTTVATVTTSGLVTSLSAGQATITATSEGVLGSSTVSAVAPAPVAVATVTLAPATATLQIGGALQLSATTKDASGNVLTGRTVTWSSSAPSIATVSASGLVTAVTAGQATIVATSEGASGQAAITDAAPVQAQVASITITPSSGSMTVGQSLQLTATAKDAQGNVLTGKTFTWVSLGTAVAAVSAVGVVTAIAPGTANIQVSSDAVSAQASYSVTSTSAVLASTGFEDGTLGPYYYPYTQAPNDLQIVSDPTNSGHGKVVRLHYWRADSTTSDDRNRAFTMNVPGGIGYGQSLYFKGSFFVPQPQAGMENQNRKLLYFYKNGGSSYPDFAVVGIWGNGLRFEGGAVGATTTANNITTVNFNQWYTIETRLTINSSPTTADGVFSIWLNGTLVWQKTGMYFMQHTGTNENFNPFSVGEQVNASMLYDEYRYWDDCTFSTAFIQ